MVRTFLSLGSNLGNRRQYLESAIEGCAQHAIEVIRIAGIYETEPLEVTDQPRFLNTVVEAKTDLDPRQLLDACLSIERANHRVRVKPKAARTIDIDIIFYDERIVNEAGLIIPHSRFRERRFVLAPLAEIAPDTIDPVSHLSVETLFANCPDVSRIRRLQHIP